MRIAVTCLIAAGTGLLAAQHLRALSPSIRSIRVKAISGCQTNSLTPIKIEVLEAAWKAGKVNLAVESQLDLASIDKAKRVIREEYARLGHAVTVEQEIMQIQPRGVEVSFRVLELCGFRKRQRR